MPWPTAFELIAGCVLWLVLATVYVRQVLPRLAAPTGAALTALLALGLVVASAFVPARAVWMPWLGAAALVAGHLGWVASRRRRPPPAGPVPGHAERAPVDPAPAAARVGADRMLGRYRIERLLGRGAMGAVYQGLDPRIGRTVAIKTMALRREFEGTALAEARERFVREADAAGRLHHPDIVTVFDAGEDHGLAYIAMEFVTGHDLQPHTRPGRLLPPEQVAGIGARVAEALAYAHREGVVHRDIKPANVMIDAASGTLKVTDFGIARVVDASRTRTGMVLGTPSFMSPEQMAGLRVDGRSDLYSLGAMLFQLLTGALPHQSESMARLMYRIANEPAVDIRTLRPELPEALATVVARALEKRPDMRYADGREMADDLRAAARMLDR